LKSEKRIGLTALGKVTVVALVGVAIILVDAQPILLRRLDPELTTLAALTVLVCVVVLVGWRWAPALGALWPAVLWRAVEYASGQRSGWWRRSLPGAP